MWKSEISCNLCGERIVCQMDDCKEKWEVNIHWGGNATEILRHASSSPFYHLFYRYLPLPIYAETLSFSDKFQHNPVKMLHMK